MPLVAHLADRSVLRLAGADARPFLQGLLTNDVEQLAPGRPLWAALLSAQGKVLFDMILHAEDDVVMLDVEAARAEELAKRLAIYRLRRAVTIEPAPLAIFAAWDGASGQTPDPRTPALGERWVARRASGNADGADYARHRLSLGVPEGSADLLIDRTMWLEANAVELNGVSFTKGCYVGQENTARMHHRDRLRKRLLPVRLTGGTRDGHIMAGEREAGELRSTAGDIGLALLRLEHVGAGIPLTLGGEAVEPIKPEWMPSAEPN